MELQHTTNENNINNEISETDKSINLSSEEDVKENKQFEKNERTI